MTSSFCFVTYSRPESTSTPTVGIMVTMLTTASTVVLPRRSAFIRCESITIRLSIPAVPQRRGGYPSGGSLRVTVFYASLGQESTASLLHCYLGDYAVLPQSAG